MSIGTTSFGKGSVQTVIALPNEGELVLTWARFHAPSGYPLQDLGISPTICTSGSTQTAAQIVEAARTGRMTSPAAMAAWRAADHSNPERMKELRQICPPDSRESDLDLQVAREILADRVLFARALSVSSQAAQAR